MLANGLHTAVVPRPATSLAFAAKNLDSSSHSVPTLMETELQSTQELKFEIANARLVSGRSLPTLALPQIQ